MKTEREENEPNISKSSDIYIPLDLQVEILKKLPVKSFLRFRCVSKQWSSIIRSRYFNDSIIARPLAQPPNDNFHFIFHHNYPNPFFFFSSTYTYKEQEAISIPPEITGDWMYQYVRGLILCSSVYSSLIIIYNPTTRQSISLPELEIEFQSDQRNCFFGYDSVMNQYKVMCVINGKYESEDVCKVFTLGDPMKQWKNLQSIGNHYPILQRVHINGVIYYGAINNNNNEDMVMSFDFNSERFYRINAPTFVAWNFGFLNLVNYREKLGCLCTISEESNIYGAEMWVMEDAEKQTWSKIFYVNDLLFTDHCFSGVTKDGDILIVKLLYGCDGPLYVYYYNPKQNSLRRTEIKSSTARSQKMIILGVSDHVENIMSLHHIT